MINDYIHKKKCFYLLGIGGISMSALAIFLENLGNFVSGYDQKPSKMTTSLKNYGINVDFSLQKEKIKSADFVVFSSAIKAGDKCLEFAKSQNKTLVTRGQLLGAISEDYSNVIAVAGSHGKTTTTAMIFEILKVAGKNPTLHLGGLRCDDNKNFCLGGKNYLVTEACEYCDNFLNLHPTLAVVTNVESEHLDYFKTFENQLKSFEKFKNQSQFVIEQNEDYRAKYIRHRSDGRLSFSIFYRSKKVLRLNLNLVEDVNAQNCIYAYRVAKKLGISDEEIKLGLESFKGVKTRFEKVNCKHFGTAICDYSHHPTEIANAIYSARKIFAHRQLVVVFQPHTFSRTKILLEDFLSVLEKVDSPIVFKTYSAREVEQDGVSGKTLAKVLLRRNKNACYADDFESLEKILVKLPKNAAVMFVGAGDLPDILHKKNFIS